MSALNIFLDDGGVITDKQRRAAEFGRLVGDYFVLLLGGTAEAWTCAHRAVVDRLAEPQSASALTAADFVSFYRAYQLHWVAEMCELLDLPTPPEEDSCIVRGTCCTPPPGRALWNWPGLVKGWVCGTASAISTGPT